MHRSTDTSLSFHFALFYCLDRFQRITIVSVTIQYQRHCFGAVFEKLERFKLTNNRSGKSISREYSTGIVCKTPSAVCAEYSLVRRDRPTVEEVSQDESQICRHSIYAKQRIEG